MALLHTPNALIGASAANFSLLGVDEHNYTLETSRGPHGLLVMFICNHCPYVKAIRERLIADCKDLINAGIGVVAINSNDAKTYPEDSFEAMQAIAAQCEFPFPYLLDETQSVAHTYGAVCTPDFFGYNAKLELQYRGRLDAAHRGPREPGMYRELVDAMLEIARSGRTMLEQVPSMGCSIKWR